MPVLNEFEVRGERGGGVWVQTVVVSEMRGVCCGFLEKTCGVMFLMWGAAGWESGGGGT